MMSSAVKTQEDAKYAEVGKLLSARLHEARAKKGLLRCPNCLRVFDATHLIKCPGCRTLIGNAFQEWRDETRPQAEPLPFLKECAPAAPPRPKKRRVFRPRKILEAAQLELDFFTRGCAQYPG